MAELGKMSVKMAHYTCGSHAGNSAAAGVKREALPALLPLLYTFTEPEIFAALKGRERILDIGCGDGWLTLRIAQSIAPREIVAIDKSETLIRAAWEKHPNPIVQYLVMDAESERLQHLGLFDAIFLRNTFHHFCEKEKFLTRAKDQLRSGGILLIVDLDLHANYCLFGILATFLRSIQFNGLFTTLAIAWNTRFFLEPSFRRHRRQDYHLLQATGWLEFESIARKASTALPSCQVGRIGSIAGFGGCYYILCTKASEGGWR